MTSESSVQPEATTRQRPVLTPEQREQKNRRDRERRAAKNSARQAQQGPPVPNEADLKEATLGQQQSRRDQPFQHALSMSLQAETKARFTRQRESQRKQIEIREGIERKHSGKAA